MIYFMPKCISLSINHVLSLGGVFAAKKMVKQRKAKKAAALMNKDRLEHTHIFGTTADDPGRTTMQLHKAHKVMIF